MKEKKVSESLWLQYFNNYLFEKGIITEREYAQMTEKIVQREAKNRRK